MTLDDPIRLETGEHESIHVLLQRNPVLQTQRHGDGEAVEKAAEGGAFPMHVQKDLTEAPVRIVSGTQEQAVPADLGFLGVAVATAGQRPAFVPEIGCGSGRGLDSRCFRLRSGGALLVELIGAPLATTLQGQDLFGQPLAGSA